MTISLGHLPVGASLARPNRIPSGQEPLNDQLNRVVLREATCHKGLELFRVAAGDGGFVGKH